MAGTMTAERWTPTYSLLPSNPSTPTCRDTSQIDFAIRMLNQYLAVKNVPAVGVRRLHYYIVSLPATERQMPGRDGIKLYENTAYQYQDLSQLLVKARTEGKVPSDWIVDEKNPALIPMPEREPADVTWEIHISTPQLPELKTEAMPGWDDWLQSFEYSPHITPPVFNNQKYRIVVAIEKATSKARLVEICQRYGADLLIFSGQPSLTRVYDICRRAMDEDKPVLILYISDMDIAGWNMPGAFLSRVQQIYPRDDHKLMRLALTREQAAKHRLPTAFDAADKGYNKTQIEAFITESGGRDCTELDALDEKILLELLDDELEQYSGRKDDNREYDRTQEEAYAIKDTIDPCDTAVTELQVEYEAVRDRHNLIVGELKSLSEKYREEIFRLNTRKIVLESKAKDAIIDKYDLTEYEWEGL